ncbi:MAG: NnrU family protein [Desulfofustis sp.]|nr:NnrU family protein [Desulfofustis sp.]
MHSLPKQTNFHPSPDTPPSRFNDWIAVIVSLALYLAFLFWLHEMLFGVSPM